MKKFEFLEHTSEIKFRAYGKTLEKAFESAVIAISEYLSRGEKIEVSEKREMVFSAEDEKSMLYDFIEELVYLLETENFIVSRAKIKIIGNKLKGILYGDDALRYPQLDHIKAATYSEMEIKQKKDKTWEIQAVLDV